MSSYFDREKAQKTVALVYDKVKTEADLQLLEEYQRVFKKEVPLFHRSKAAAYLLMLCAEGKNLRFKSHSRADRGKREEGAEPQRYPLSDEESKRLFFNVGRSRRVFPREILGIINTKTAIPKEDIGAIRILDNYSFVQVRDTVAEKIIEALNGYMFRGRPLVVNYAKSRKDEENGEYPDSEQGQDQAEEEDI